MGSAEMGGDGSVGDGSETGTLDSVMAALVDELKKLAPRLALIRAEGTPVEVRWPNLSQDSAFPVRVDCMCDGVGMQPCWHASTRAQ